MQPYSRFRRASSVWPPTQPAAWTTDRLLDGLIDNIYVYPDKLAAACFYSDYRRELPFGETAKLIENAKATRFLAYLQSVPEKVLPKHFRTGVQLPSTPPKGGRTNRTEIYFVGSVIVLVMLLPFLKKR